MKILVINPGGTSTKIAVFEHGRALFSTSIIHTQQDLASYPKVFSQLTYRKDLILNKMAEANISVKNLSAVVGRGGLMKPIKGGTYRVNEAMINDLREEINGEHASNLGCVLAKEIADLSALPSFVVDPVSVDEFDDVVRITGIKDLVKASWLHSLNQKAVARIIAAKIGKKYEECNFIIAHLGSGISTVAHMNGLMVDGTGGRTDGPFSPERSGGLPTYPLIKLCYSGKYTKTQMIDKVSNTGGFFDYLGTKDMEEIESRVTNGDEEATLIYHAFIYQASKEIASFGATLYGKVDRIILTGGMAHSALTCKMISQRVSYLAPVEIVAGEMEMKALYEGALRVLEGVEREKEYE